MEVGEIIETISKQNIRWIRLLFYDINGRLKEVTISSSLLYSSTFEKGIELEEVNNLFHETGLVLKPIPETFSLIPWEDSGALLMCKIEKDGSQYQKDTIGLLEKVTSLYDLEGIGKLQIQPSIEFSIYETVSVDKTLPERGPSTNIDSRESPWNPNPLVQTSDWNLTTMPHDVYSLIRIQILDSLFSFSRLLTTSHSHGDAPNKQYVLFSHMDVFNSAFAISALKYFSKNIALLNGALATFMPYPSYKFSPNRMRFRIRLVKNTNDVFYSPDDENGVSKIAHHFIGGIITHAPSLTLFTNPTTNFYKSLIHFPIFNGWSVDLNNTIIKVYSKTKSTIVEVSLADSSANPFLALSTILLAGLDGIKKKISKFSPLVSEEPTEKERKSSLGEDIPYNLYESIKSYEKDNAYLKKIISPLFISDYITLKLEEYKKDISQPSQFDYVHYFNL